MTWLCFAVCISLIGVSLQHKSNIRLEVEPHYIQVPEGTPVTMTCTLRDGDGGRVPLAGCGFRDHWSKTSWDLGTGSSTTNSTTEGHRRAPTMGIINNQEHAGLCSLKVAGLSKWSTYILGCRVRPAVGGAWLYAAMMVRVDYFTPMQYRLQPPAIVVSLPGSDVILLGEAEEHVDVCRFSLPPNNTWIYLRSWDTSKNTTQYRLWRGGLPLSHQCGVTLLGVQPSRSGFVISEVWSRSTYRTSFDFVEVLVATPPGSPPRLSVKITNTTFQAGDMLHATCVVDESRPVANITWLLGGDVVREDNWNEAPVESTWRWNHEPHMMIQRLSRRLKQRDNGKKLKCQARHLALPSGTLESNTHIIRVIDACSSSPCGPHSVCRAHGYFASCSCKPPYIGQPPSCRSECHINGHCPLDKVCVNQTCQDPCPMTGCGQDAVCHVVNRVPTCRCPVNFRGDPKTLCEPIIACGVQAATTSLVAGGRTTVRGAWPWLAAIYENTYYSFVCGGSLISNKHVLTAAHCIKSSDVDKNYEKDQILVVLGRYEQSKQFERDNEPRNVTKLHIHQMFDKSQSSKFDIALLVLDDPVAYTRFIQPICLFSSDFTSNLLYQSGTVVGWGETHNETITNVPREGGVRIVSLEECRSDFPLMIVVTNKYSLCGGYKNGTGPCAGDSGGPLMVRAIASDGVLRWHLRGIVSTALGDDYCNTDVVIYTDVVKLYTSWLKPLLTG